jgi:hypothetical protein
VHRNKNRDSELNATVQSYGAEVSGEGVLSEMGCSWAGAGRGTYSWQGAAWGRAQGSIWKLHRRV